MKRAVHLYYSTAHRAHEWMEAHPENPQRVESVLKTLMPAVGAGAAALHTFRDCAVSDTKRHWLLDTMGDTYATDGTADVLLVTQEMISAAVQDAAHCSFVLCRPPGHHAFVTPSGFCHENNAWFAANHYLRQGKKDICIFDMDAHHGDGTEACVRTGTAGVRFVSTHAFGPGIFPGSGAAYSDSRILNLPLARHTSPSSYMRVLRNDVLPFIGKPDVLIVSAGYDTHKQDPMKLMNLNTETFGKIGRLLKSIGVPVLFLLEGGYNTSVLGDCVLETLTPWLKNDA